MPRPDLEMQRLMSCRLMSCRWLFGWLSALVLVVLLLVGCNSRSSTTGDSAPALSFDWKLTPSAPKVGAARCTLALRDTQGKPVAGAKIKLEGNMSHPGMQPVLAEMKEVAPGQYSGALNFTMGGDWFVLIDATLPDGRVWHQQIKVPNVRSD